MKGAFACFVVFLASVVGALAQGGAQSQYTIRPDDVLRIQVYGEQQINVEVPVGQDGNVSAPFVGSFHAEGKTPAQLEVELRQAYIDKLRLRDPKVSVNFARYRALRASIGGAVQRAGQYDFRPGDTILTLIHEGGDVLPAGSGNPADLHRAMLHRRGSEEAIPIDLNAMLLRGDLSQNYELQDGDQLLVPTDRKGFISILGFIQRPGQYAYREPMSLSDAISIAGGEIPQRSMMSKVKILREVPTSPGSFMQIEANFVQYLNKGDISQNVKLQPGDMVYVPATKTPDWNQVASLVNSAFYIQNLLRGGFFGLKLFH